MVVIYFNDQFLSVVYTYHDIIYYKLFYLFLISNKLYDTIN